MLPPFHGEALKRWAGDDRRDHPRRARHVAARQAAQGAAADAGDHARGDPARDLRQPRPGAARRAAARARHDRLDCRTWSRCRSSARTGGSPGAVERIDELIYARIDEPGGGDSILDLLKASGATREELRDQLVTLLAAGHETTATALAWACERLARHPAPTRHRPADRRLRPGGPAHPARALHHRPQDAAAVPLERHTVPEGVYVAACLYLAHRRRTADPAHVHPVRRRNAPLSRCRVRHARDAGSHPSGEPTIPNLRPDRARRERMRRRSVVLAPSRQGSIVPITR